MKLPGVLKRLQLRLMGHLDSGRGQNPVARYRVDLSDLAASPAPQLKRI
jgi:hypothetical protein